MWKRVSPPTTDLVVYGSIFWWALSWPSDPSPSIHTDFCAEAYGSIGLTVSD
jgi:hypothetical protein